MDGQRFDALVVQLAGGPASRRRALRGVVGGALAAALTRLGPEEAAAAPCRGLAANCGGDDQCCTKRCVRGTCRCPRGTKQKDQSTCLSNEDGACPAVADTCTAVDFQCTGEAFCACFRDVNGTPRCLDEQFSSDPDSCVPCDKNRDCNAQTGVPGSACIKARGFCKCPNGSATFCLPPCGKG